MVESEYVIMVKTLFFNYSHSLLSDDECCDANETRRSGSCAFPGCYSYFQYCLSFWKDKLIEHLNHCETSQINYNDAPINFSAPIVLGLHNPLRIQGPEIIWSPNVSFLIR